MRITRVSVGAEKRASDGDYGNEMSRAELFADLEPGEDVHTALDELLGLIRLELEHDISQSTNLKVRRSVIREVRRCNRCDLELDDRETGYMHKACSEAERTEREARYREQRAEQERRWKQAEDELAAGLRARDEEDDDEELATAGAEDKPF